MTPECSYGGLAPRQPGGHTPPYPAPLVLFSLGSDSHPSDPTLFCVTLHRATSSVPHPNGSLPWFSLADSLSPDSSHPISSPTSLPPDFAIKLDHGTASSPGVQSFTTRHLHEPSMSIRCAHVGEISELLFKKASSVSPMVWCFHTLPPACPEYFLDLLVSDSLCFTTARTCWQGTLGRHCWETGRSLHVAANVMNFDGHQRHCRGGQCCQ